MYLHCHRENGWAGPVSRQLCIETTQLPVRDGGNLCQSLLYEVVKNMMWAL